MRRITTAAFLIALAILLGVAMPALAWGGEETSVVCGDISVTGNQQVGQTITVSGTVTVTTNSESHPDAWQWGYAYGYSNAGFGITDPYGSSAASGANSASDAALGYNIPGVGDVPAFADASQTYGWSQTFVPDWPGNWTATHGGDAYAEWATYFLVWQTGYGNGVDSGTFSRTFTVAPAFTGNGLVPGLPGQFPILVCASPWRTFWVDEDITTYDGLTNFKGDVLITWGNCMLFIPEGTYISGKCEKVCFLQVSISNGVISLNPPYMSFSQPVTISQFQLVGGGGWTLVTFTQVSNGQPLPLE